MWRVGGVRGEMNDMAVQSVHLSPQWQDDVRGFFAQLRHRTRFLLAASLAGLALAGVYLNVVPARYNADTEVFLDPRGLQVVQNDVTPRQQQTSEMAAAL